MRKLLIVEDSATVRAFVKSALEDAAFQERVGDCEIFEATCGFDAMRVLPRVRYDLIVTDINMKDINGLELIHFIRRSEHHREVPLVIISSQGAVRDIDRGLALGASAYLPKPFTPELLRDTCARLLEPTAA